MSLIGPPNCSDPPWQVIVLVANHLDPKTLAMASCVCKSWSISMSSDHLWEPICSTHFPSLYNLRSTAPAVPYRRLYALGHKSALRRQRPPVKPRVSMNDITFAIDIRNGKSHAVTLVIPGGAGPLVVDSNGLFRFDVDIVRGGGRSGSEELVQEDEALGEFEVTWNVMLRGFESVFTMMDFKGKGSFVSGSDGWFSEELPSPGCCTSSRTTSGLVSELRLGLRGRVVEKVSLGVLSIVSWRYVCIDDALRYLQHFLVGF